MNVRVAGHQVKTGEALRAHANDRMSAITGRYFDRAAAASVTFGRGPHEAFTCNIVAPVAQGVVLKASGQAQDAHVAFEGAADKIERQLARYVGRLRNHKGNGAEPGLIEDAGYTIFAASTTAEDPPLSPPVIAETKVDIPDATVSDAVMMLDLRNTNALMFRNLASGAFNMVYRRDDGTIGWVEPQPE